MQWIKFYTGKWLYGSGRTMTPEKRGVWADLLALCAETKLRDGTLRFDIGQPMPRSYIAGVLLIPEDLLNTCIEAFKGDLNTEDGQPRVRVWDDGTIELTNFNRLQQGSEDGSGKKHPKGEGHGQNQQSTTNGDPDKYVKGKYGHMVKR